MRTLIGTIVALIAALFSSCADPVLACEDDYAALRTEEHRLRAEREAIEARLAAQHRVQRARAALAEKRAQAAR